MTTMGTLTLTDFLLARIAEDEARFRWAVDSGDIEWFMPAARLLAECEAKRRIVAMGDGSADFHQGVLARDGYQPFHTPSIDVLTRVQQLLALPYADHPDYRPEWAV